MDCGAMWRSHRRPTDAWIRRAVSHLPPTHWCCAPRSVSERSSDRPRDSLGVQACPFTLPVLTLPLRQTMHLLPLEGADNRLHRSELLLVLLHPVRSAGSRTEIDLLEQILRLVPELR